MEERVDTQGATGDAEPALDPQITAVLEGLDKEETHEELPPELDAISKIDFSKIPHDKLLGVLPKEIREGLLRQDDYTRKTQALAEERRNLERSSLESQNKLLQTTIERLTQAGVEATPDLVEQIKQKIADGDQGAIVDLVQAEVTRRISPVEKQLAISEAMETARLSIPDFDQNRKEIEDVLRANSDLPRLASAFNYKAAPYVLQGVAAVVRAQKIQAEYDKLKASIPDLIKKGIQAYRQKAAGLPTATSRAGGVQATPGKGKDLDARAAMDEAWGETVGRG